MPPTTRLRCWRDSALRSSSFVLCFQQRQQFGMNWQNDLLPAFLGEFNRAAGGRLPVTKIGVFAGKKTAGLLYPSFFSPTLEVIPVHGSGCAGRLVDLHFLLGVLIPVAPSFICRYPRTFRPSRPECGRSTTCRLPHVFAFSSRFAFAGYESLRLIVTQEPDGQKFGGNGWTVRSLPLRVQRRSQGSGEQPAQILTQPLLGSNANFSTDGPPLSRAQRLPSSPQLWHFAALPPQPDLGSLRHAAHPTDWLFVRHQQRAQIGRGTAHASGLEVVHGPNPALCLA